MDNRTIDEIRENETELIRDILKLEKELENKRKEYQETYKDVRIELKEKDKEIERLKNGIKELDNMFYETFRISQNGYFSISEWELKDFTDKLKELKEGK